MGGLSTAPHRGGLSAVSHCLTLFVVQSSPGDMQCTLKVRNKATFPFNLGDSPRKAAPAFYLYRTPVKRDLVGHFISVLDL